MGKVIYLATAYIAGVAVVLWIGGWGVATGAAIFGGLWLAYAWRHPKRGERRV